jgi:hypothetical protein
VFDSSIDFVVTATAWQVGCIMYAVETSSVNDGFLDTGGATSLSEGCDHTPVLAGRLRRRVSIRQRIVAICNIIIITAMCTMSVAYTRSTGS